MSEDSKGVSLRQYLKLTPATETLLLAVLVGVLGGFGALVFKKLIFGLQGFFWATEHMEPDALLAVVWYKRLILPVIGGAIVGPLIYFFAREARGHGVPEVMIAVMTRNSVIRPMVVVVKALASAFSIATGGSVGREGPIVQIGAAIASSLGQVLRVRPLQLKTLVGCGVAAGIGATFNAPMAATLFAMELIVTDFGLTSFTPILVSAVTATAITHKFHGNLREFVLPEFSMVSGWEFGLYLVLGVLAGVIGWMFTRVLYRADDLFDKTPIPQWIRPAIGGLLVGCMGLVFPHVMGVGYDTIKVMFEGHLTLDVMALLVFLKIAATAITIGSGGSGGVFAPSLFMGAMLGGAFGALVNRIFPEMTAPMGAYALVGMAAVNGACTLAPLSAIIILVELTDEYSMILPLMFTVVMASLVSRKLNAESIYTEKLKRRGIQAHHGEDMNILRAVKVKHVLRHDEAAIQENAGFNQLVQLAMEKHRNVIFTLDAEGRYTGVMSFQDLKYILQNPKELEAAYHIQDFTQDIAAAQLDQTLDLVIDRFAETGFDRLPVVDKQGNLAGSIVISDVMRSYNEEVANRNMAIELGARIQAHDECHRLDLGGDMVIMELEVPRWMEGQALGDLGLRTQYLVSVFVVKEQEQGGGVRFVTPGADYVFRGGDTMLVGGGEDAIRALEKRT